jgi:tetratricopeptide (TPR) repeat protein
MITNGAVTLYNRRLEFKILSNWGKYKEALSSVKAFMADHGDDVEALNIAKICSHFLGDHEEALKFGQKVLFQKDKLASALRLNPFVIRPNKKGKQIIAFSVWGENKAYLYGAAINVELATRYFPNWVVRIYGASSIPSNVLDLYRRLGAEVVLADQEYPDVPAYFWRFLVADDSDTQHFLCRDADCRLSAEEFQLVGSWLESRKRFHVIRDHVLHDELILAGMWGGVGSGDWKMRGLISEYFNGKPTNKYGHDQIFLRKMVWSHIKQQVFVHDRYYWTPGVKSHKHAYERNFGEGHTNEKSVCREAVDLGLIQG